MFKIFVKEIETQFNKGSSVFVGTEALNIYHTRPMSIIKILE